MIVCFLKKVVSSTFEQRDISWDGFCRLITCHDRVVENTHLHSVKIEQPAFILAEFFDTESKNQKNCKAVPALVLDIDGKTRKLFRTLKAGERLFPHRYVVYSTMNHLVDGSTPKLRVVVPYDKPIPPERHRAVATDFAAALVEKWGCEVDTASYNPVQCFTFGVRNPKSTPFVDVRRGPALEVEPLLKNIRRREKKQSPAYVNADHSVLDEQLCFIPAAKIDHDGRQRILMAIYAELGEDGHDVAAHWYHKKGEEFEAQWKSAKNVREITVGTIHHYALRHGWSPRNLILDGKGAVENYAQERMADVKNNHRAPLIKQVLGNSYPCTAQKLDMGDSDFDLEALKSHSKQLLRVGDWKLLEYVSDDLKKKFLEWFDAYKEERLCTVRIPASKIKYLKSHVFQKKVEFQAWVSQHGSGKTREIGQQVLEWAHCKGRPIVFINDRQIATAKIAERLDIPSYDKVKKWRDKSKWETLEAVAVCVNSLAHPAFKSILAREPVIVIDEVAQVLSALQFGLFGELGSAKVDEVFNVFVRAIRIAPRLVVMDANLTQFHLDILMQLTGYDGEIRIYSRELQALKLNVEYGFDHGSQKKFKAEALHRLIENLDAGIKSMVPMEGRRAVSELKLTLERCFDPRQAKRAGIEGESSVMGTRKEEKRIDLLPKIATVTSQRSRDREELLTENVQKFFAGHDAFLHTASVSSCLSNEVKEYSGAVAWFPGHLLTPTEMTQMLFRGRNVTNAVLALNTQYANRLFAYRAHDYGDETSWAVPLHRKISRKLHAHRKAEQQDSLRTLLWFLGERGAHIGEMKLSSTDGFAKMLAEGREEFVNQILSARSISEHEYDENRTCVFHGDVSAFTEAEDYAYHTRRKFALGADDSLTRGHVLLATSMPDVSSVIDRTAVFLYDGSWNGFRRGTPPRHTDVLLFVFGPIKALTSCLSDATNTAIRESLRKGEWLLDDAEEIVTAVMKNRKALIGNRFLSALVPDELREKAHNAILTKSERQLVDKAFRTAFGLHIRNKHADLIVEAATRRQVAFPDLTD
jgi:hypothetical protein